MNLLSNSTADRKKPAVFETGRLVMENRSPAMSGLTFTHRAADEKKFPALCRFATLLINFVVAANVFEDSAAIRQE